MSIRYVLKQTNNYLFRQQSVYIIKTTDPPIQQNIFTKLETNNITAGKAKKF